MSDSGSEGGDRFLTADEERTLLGIARQALETYVRERVIIEVSGYYLTPALTEGHGAFVTLRRDGELRGCVGHTTNTHPLAECVRDSAIHAATQDPRFSPVTVDELDGLRLEISALGSGDTAETPFIRIPSADAVRIGRDGLMVRTADSRGGLLLPQVAVERGWDAPTFLDAVCRKAGMLEGAWSAPETEIYRFTAHVFCEEGYCAD